MLIWLTFPEFNSNNEYNTDFMHKTDLSMLYLDQRIYFIKSIQFLPTWSLFFNQIKNRKVQNKNSYCFTEVFSSWIRSCAAVWKQFWKLFLFKMKFRYYCLIQEISGCNMKFLSGNTEQSFLFRSFMSSNTDVTLIDFVFCI